MGYYWIFYFLGILIFDIFMSSFDHKTLNPEKFVRRLMLFAVIHYSVYLDVKTVQLSTLAIFSLFN